MGAVRRVKLRVTKRAGGQIDAALQFVARESPADAAKVAVRLRAVLELLLERPLAGRATSKPPIRRIFLTPYPYLIDYRPSDDEIVVLRFRHTSRRPIA